MQAAGIEVIFDDRDVRPGVMFADMELIGIPHRVVIGEKNLDQGRVEYRGRRDAESRDIPTDEIVPFLKQQLG
jgi:prolyl-tRNA synthetase